MEDKNGRFRKKKVNFSMVSNTIIRDEKISLKAKGLYTLIQSYITIDNFTLYKSFLMKKCIEGERAFDSAWKELKEKGYLKQYKMREGARSFYYEYELLDEPETEIVTQPSVEVHNVGVHDISKHCVDHTRSQCNNKTVERNNLPNNNINNNQIVSIDDVKYQIGYNVFSQIDNPFINEIALLITEVLNASDDKILRIEKENVKASIVKQRFGLLNVFHVEYVLKCMKENVIGINNIKNYLLTSLYNAPLTMNMYYQNKMKCWKENNNE